MMVSVLVVLVLVVLVLVVSAYHLGMAVGRMPQAGRLSCAAVVSRGAILNRTYGTHKKLYISLFLLTILGPIYCGPP